MRQRKRQIKIPEPRIIKDPIEAAAAAGLRHISDDQPGIRRKRAGKQFTYLQPDGTKVTAEDELKRIRSLAIPPAYTNVWIAPDPLSHIQATGRDARGRKQYRYHPRWREVRDETKYGRMIIFGQALPQMRARMEHDLVLPGLPRAKVLAAVVRLLEMTLIRVGNDEYARTNKSYGLTTMQDRHVELKGSTLRFKFKGKSGVRHTINVSDARIARIVKRCRDLPGQDLFQYLDDNGKRQDVTSDDVNIYLKDISGHDFTAKDFRTWAGTVLAAFALTEFAAFDKQTQAKKNIVHAIETVAARLGNTPSVCRKCYVHPEVINAYMDGTLLETLQQRAAQELEQTSGLEAEEVAVLAFLQTRLAQAAQDEANNTLED